MSSQASNTIYDSNILDIDWDLLPPDDAWITDTVDSDLRARYEDCHRWAVIVCYSENYSNVLYIQDTKIQYVCLIRKYGWQLNMSDSVWILGLQRKAEGDHRGRCIGFACEILCLQCVNSLSLRSRCFRFGSNRNGQSASLTIFANVILIAFYRVCASKSLQPRIKYARHTMSPFIILNLHSLELLW
jgi:hypothetical protein